MLLRMISAATEGGLRASRNTFLNFLVEFNGFVVLLLSLTYPSLTLIKALGDMTALSALS